MTRRSLVLTGWAVSLVVGLVGCPKSRLSNMPGREDPLTRGLALYEENCARCHGDRGLGDGPEAPFLYPMPRNFSVGNFRLTSNTRGFPDEEDMLRAIRDGLPGSAMPPWHHLPAEDLQALVAAVKHLAIEGKTRNLMEAAEERGAPMTVAAATQLARDWFAPGPPVDLPAAVPETPSTVARGRQLYEELCVSCHALEGGVSPKRDMQDDTGAYIYPRNFKSGLLLRGNSEEALALTILRGLPGTPMPAYELPADDVWALVHFVRALPEGAKQDEVAAPPEATRIALTGVADPGVWTDEAVEVGYRGTAPVAAAHIVLHEGEQVILELKSADVTHGFYSPELGIGPLEVYPGHTRIVRFEAPAPGEYEFFCMNMCGHCHFSMKGSILVLPKGAEPAGEDLAAHCEPGDDAPAGVTSVIDRGRAVYRKMACATCHGEEGRGGVRNVNALPTERVIALDRLAEKLWLRGPTASDIETALGMLEQGQSFATLFPDDDLFSRQYETVSRSILAGELTPRKDPAGPDPPLQMPAMKARLRTEEIDAVLAYLVSVYDRSGPEPIHQVVAFNHMLHVEDLGLECMDCHEPVLEDRGVGVPRNETCEPCHDPSDRDESTSADLGKLYDYFERDVEIPWARVHELPEHVVFSHRRHVTAANLDCANCHGELARYERPPTRAAFNLKMNWCMDCHEFEGASNECRACHADT
ncbi:MAG: c-type cytochrome [Acidobacteria bacterium]|nr:c-type cytochrome [Acidobacteriota bacterium]NIO60893.1 c-type cytochrome [Acidobacteriota bacterium]NIQ31085.1 c-type cytochrome [Acidobacteriota bacterium]NIQ87354.1 c-type cytochrome [Acidobacteriota bacterium]NIT12558.1 c-type cytochrome [Acidobacteriota bacterium]